MQRITIAGGGTAGWMAAVGLAHILKGTATKVTLIESEEVGIIGVGEATIPPILDFQKMVGIDEDEFVATCQATFKLGIEFVNWRQKGTRYIHPFGQYGQPLDGIPFHHHWLRYRAAKQAAGQDYLPLHAFSLAARAADAQKFMRPIHAPNTPLEQIRYAFHFDAHLYARFLRGVAEARGVERIEGRIETVEQHPESGDIVALKLSDERRIEGDLFIDCTGFRGLLIGAMGAAYEDWTHWLPCDRAVAVPCESAGPPDSHTRATAHDAGWQWHIPLQHRVGNGHVFASAFTDQDAATETLLANLEGKPLADPRLLTFTTGRRREFWKGNCVAIGLSAGFLEPLESTSIHLSQSSIMRLIALLPNGARGNGGGDPASRALFNSRTAQEYDRLRDFIILHYHQTERNDSEFWNHMRTMSVPDSLTERVALYRETGRILSAHEELFGEANWLAVLEGQGVAARNWHPAANRSSDAELFARLERVESVVGASLGHIPSHQDFIDAHCRAA